MKNIDRNENETFFFIAALGLIIILCLSGCKQEKYIPVISHDTITTVKDHYLHDSTFRDRWHYEFVKGDSVIIRDSIYVVRWYMDTSSHDSIIVRTDSISYPVTHEVVKTEHVRGILWWTGLVTLVSVIIIFAIKLIKYIKK